MLPEVPETEILQVQIILVAQSKFGVHFIPEWAQSLSSPNWGYFLSNFLTHTDDLDARPPPHLHT